MKSFQTWWKPFIGLGFCLIYPSIAIFKKIGYFYLITYTVAALLLLWLAIAWFVPLLKTRISARHSMALLTLLLVLLLAAYLAIHPHIDTQGFHLFGKTFGASDGDDAIDVAISELLGGRYPYFARTFLGNPLTPMPGALLLALPFYILGDSGVQNLFWLAVFFIMVAKFYRDSFLAAILAYMVCFFSPNVVYQIMTGSDYISNSIYTLVFSLMVLKSAKQGKSFDQCAFWSVLLGIGLSSRLNFSLNLIIIMFTLLKVTSRQKAIGLILIVLASFTVVTLPAFAYAPSDFSPLHTANMLSIGGSLAWAPFAVPLLGAMLALFLAFKRGKNHVSSIVKDIFLVQVFLMVSGLVLAWLLRGRISLEYPHFGILFFFYGIWAFGPKCLLESEAVSARIQPKDKSNRSFDLVKA